MPTVCFRSKVLYNSCFVFIIANGKELISVRCKEESFLHSDLDYPLLEVKNEDRVHIKLFDVFLY